MGRGYNGLVSLTAGPARAGSQTADEYDEYVVDTPGIRAFIRDVRSALAAHAGDAPAALEALRPRFAALLADQSWLPEAYARANPDSGMGGGIGQWLLYRARDGSLCLFSLVIPPWKATPVHDHLAWGLVGLYRGQQTETVYRRTDDGSRADRADLVVEARKPLEPGDFYVLLPPDGDIHAVVTTSEQPSVSIHLLGNDAGCVWRHAFEPRQGTVRAFRSGYANRACDHDS